MQFGVGDAFIMPLCLGKLLLRAVSLLGCENANEPWESDVLLLPGSILITTFLF